MIQNATIAMDEQGLNLYMAAMEMVNNSEIISFYGQTTFQKSGIYLLRESETVNAIKEQIQTVKKMYDDLQLVNMELRAKNKELERLLNFYQTVLEREKK